MDTEELAKWLYAKYNDFEDWRSVTFFFAPGVKIRWMKLAKELQENYLELFVKSGT